MAPNWPSWKLSAMRLPPTCSSCTGVLTRSATAPRSRQSGCLSMRRILTQDDVFWAPRTNTHRGVAMPARALGLKGSALLLLSSLAPCAHAFAAQPAAPEAVTVITAATMIDGTGAAPRRNVAVVVRADRIVSVGDLGAADLPAGARRIDLGTATLLPGLIDAHTHIFLQGEVPAEGGYDVQLLKQPLAFRAARATVSARRALEQGFTTIRDV